MPEDINRVGQSQRRAVMKRVKHFWLRKGRWKFGIVLFRHSRSRAGGDTSFNPYPTAFPYGNGMVLHFYQQQESSTTKTVHKVINKGLKPYV